MWGSEAHMNIVDLMMVIGLGSVFLIVVFGGVRTSNIMEIETPHTDAQGCEQMFKTVLAAIVLLIVLAILTSVLH